VRLEKRSTAMYIRIAVDRFFKGTLSFDRFLILAFVPDRFFIGGIDVLEFSITNQLGLFCVFRRAS